MRKLLLLLFIVISGFIQAQEMQINFVRVGALIDTFNITTVDTAWVVRTSSCYKFRVQVDWSALTGTLDGVLKIQGSANKGITYTDHADLTQPVMNAASGVVAFEDSYIVTDYIRLVFTRNNITGGKIAVNIRLIANPIQ